MVSGFIYGPPYPEEHAVPGVLLYPRQTVAGDAAAHPFAAVLVGVHGGVGVDGLSDLAVVVAMIPEGPD